ncbi:hypothetical protein [Qipengyuania sp. ASV99]|uniref:hypothetical protein n=1 Tax=Qipengyuania sp. ASV99 TaxID=3399681 RepID=UPI003A4C6A11
MSQQLTISSLFSAFALVALALFARAGEIAGDSAAAAIDAPQIVLIQAAADLDG